MRSRPRKIRLTQLERIPIFTLFAAYQINFDAFYLCNKKQSRLILLTYKMKRNHLTICYHMYLEAVVC